MNLYRDHGKRILDLCIASCTTATLAPILILIIIWLHFANKGAGVFFTQERPGKDGKIFKLIKFKSMTDEKDENGQLLPNEKRITKVGKFLRSTSLDELPQLFNILKGDMALIGPRPLLVEYLPYYTEREKTRHSVRPGVTGWAQVNGRNFVEWDKRLEMDVFYVEHISLTMDAKILLMTIKKVFLRKDIEVVPSGVKLSVDRRGKEI